MWAVLDHGLKIEPPADHLKVTWYIIRLKKYGLQKYPGGGGVQVGPRSMWYCWRRHFPYSGSIVVHPLRFQNNIGPMVVGWAAQLEDSIENGKSRECKSIHTSESKQILPFGFAEQHRQPCKHIVYTQLWLNGDTTFCVTLKFNQDWTSEPPEMDSEVIKATCLKSRRSRSRTPLWPPSFKETKCFLPADS